MATAQNVADEARGDLNDGDTSNYRWSDATMLRFINAAIRQIVILLPSANVVEEVVSLTTPDPRRTLPAGGVKFIGAWNYDSSAGTRGPALTVVELDALDSSFPEWSYPDHQGAYLNNYPTNLARHAYVHFEHVMHDPRDPKTYYVFPPPPDSQTAYLGTSGVLSGSFFQTQQTNSHSYPLPAGSDNRMIVVTFAINTATTHRLITDLVPTYGGVPMNAVFSSLTGENLDGADLASATFMLSVDGETFADDNLVLDGTAWDGTFAGGVYSYRAQVFVFDNVSPAAEDFSAGEDALEVQTATNTVGPITLAEGDLLFTHTLAGAISGGTWTPTTDDLAVTSPALTFTYDDDLATTSYRASFFAGRVGWTTVDAAGSYSVTWTMTDGNEIDNAFSWHASVVGLPMDAGASAAQLLLRYSKLPTALTALANTFPLGDEYLNAAVEYTKFRMLSTDGRFGTSPEQRMEQWNNFRMTLGLKPEVERRADPARGRAGADDNG